MPEEKFQPIYVKRGVWREALTISSPGEGRNFLTRERDGWSWLTNEITRTAPGKIWRRYLDWQAAAETAIQTWEATESDAEFRALLVSRYEQGRNLVATDLPALSLSALAEKSPKAAAIALSAYHGIEPLVDPNQYAQDEDLRVGRAVGHVLLSGVTAEGQRTSERAFVQAQSEFLSARSSFDKFQSEAEQSVDLLTAQTRQLFTQLHNEITSKHETENANWKAEVDRLKSGLEGLTASYDAQMELQAPVAYWKKKSRIHQISAKRYATVLIIYTALALLALFSVFYVSASLLPSEAKDLSVALVFKIGAMSLLTTTVAFWVGRILIRKYISDRHLFNDAQERRTMIMTYLALTRKKAVLEEDRKLILGAVFRPASDGIVKDEMAPDTAVATLLASIIKK